MLSLTAALITLTTLFTYINYRFIKLPTTIGVMFAALLFSLLMLGLSWLGFPFFEKEIKNLISNIDFFRVLMVWFLPAILFAGALHVNLRDLTKYKWRISLLATVGVVIATFAIGTLTYFILKAFNWEISFVYCLLFGALISPTDAIAVLGILKSSNAPKSLSMTIVGESLFNDGTAIVMFSVLLGVLQLGTTPSIEYVSILFIREALGAIILGLILGFGVYLLLRSIEQPQIEVMLTLALVLSGAALASSLEVSAPIALVVAGLIVGNFGRKYAMTEESRGYIDQFWELVDGLLNTLLFAFIGLELMLLPFTWLHGLVALIVAAAVLFSRLITIVPGIFFMRYFSDKTILSGTTRILVWGGLRGGVSVALVLSLPLGPERDLLIKLTYIIVLLSILVQGMSISYLVRSLFTKNNLTPASKTIK